MATKPVLKSPVPPKEVAAASKAVQDLVREIGGIAKFEPFISLSTSSSKHDFDVEILLEDCSYREVHIPGNDHVVFLLKNHPAPGETNRKIVGLRLRGIKKVLPS